MAVTDDGAAGERTLDALPLSDDGVVATLIEDLGTDILAGLFATFATDAQMRMAALRAAVDAGNLTEADRTAHSLKGASLNLGLKRLASCCDLIHQACRAGQQDVVRRLVPRAAAILDKTAVEIDRLGARLGG